MVLEGLLIYCHRFDIMAIFTSTRWRTQLSSKLLVQDLFKVFPEDRENYYF